MEKNRKRVSGLYEKIWSKIKFIDMNHPETDNTVKKGNIMSGYVFATTFVAAVGAAYFLQINKKSKLELFAALFLIFAGMSVGVKLGSEQIKKQGL